MWNFDPNQYEASEFSIIPQGDHRVRIEDVEFKKSKSGNDMFEITLSVSGHGGNLWYYLVLDPNDPKKTNQKIGTFFESFGITNYDLNCYEDWVGKDGAVRVKHDSYNGSMSAKVLFCITRAYQTKLPAWREPVYSTSTYQKSTPSPSFNSAQAIPNEYVSPVLPQRQMEFKGFSF
jgi:hypothetical protein